MYLYIVLFFKIVIAQFSKSSPGIRQWRGRAIKRYTAGTCRDNSRVPASYIVLANMYEVYILPRN